MAGLTVGDLKRILNDYDDNLPVIVSSDEEGNSYEYATSAHVSSVAVEDNGNGWSEVYPKHPDDICHNPDCHGDDCWDCEGNSCFCEKTPVSDLTKMVVISP